MLVRLPVVVAQCWSAHVGQKFKTVAPTQLTIPVTMVYMQSGQAMPITYVLDLGIFWTEEKRWGIGNGTFGWQKVDSLMAEVKHSNQLKCHTS